jgi:hypothetical protein
MVLITTTSHNILLDDYEVPTYQFLIMPSDVRTDTGLLTKLSSIH